MPYKSKKNYLLLPSDAQNCDDPGFVQSWLEILNAFPQPIYQLKTQRRILEVDLQEAIAQWFRAEFNTPFQPEPDHEWNTEEFWVDTIKENPSSEIAARAHHELGVRGRVFRDGRTYQRKRSLKALTDDYSLRQAATALDGIREEEISKAVERGDLLSSLAPHGRRTVNKHDLVDWVRRSWVKTMWVKTG